MEFREQILKLFVVLIAFLIVSSLGGAGAVGTGTENVHKKGEISDTNLGSVGGFTESFRDESDSEPSEIWNKTYGSSSVDFINTIVKFGAGYIFGGNAGFSGTEGWISEIDSAGIDVWNRTYGDIGLSSFSDIIKVKEDRFVGAATYRYGTPKSNESVVKFDKEGNIIWENKIGSEVEEGIIEINKDSNGYVGVGYKENPEDDLSQDAWIVKLDEEGNKVWGETYGGKNIEGINGVLRVNDGYVLVGYTKSYGGNDSDPWAIKVDKNGEKDWEKTYDTSGRSEIKDLVKNQDGSYVFTGERNNDLWFGEIDRSGNIEYAKFHGGENFEIGRYLVRTSDGYVIGGSTFSYDAGKGDFWLIGLDENGNEKWNKTFGGKGQDFMYDMVKDGNSYVLAGVTESYGTEGDGWLVKVGSLTIEEAIANLDSKNGIINFSELQKAISFWSQDKNVPGTQTKITFSKLQELINLWIQNKKV